MSLPLALAVLTSCSSPDGGTVDISGSWELVSGVTSDGDVVPVDGYPITLDVDGDQVTGSDGCNSYTGTVSVEGSGIAFGALAQTERACLDEAVMAAAGAYSTALVRVDSVSVGEDDLLVLAGQDVTLTFQLAAE